MSRQNVSPMVTWILHNSICINNSNSQKHVAKVRRNTITTNCKCIVSWFPLYLFSFRISPHRCQNVPRLVTIFPQIYNIVLAGVCYILLCLMLTEWIFQQIIIHNNARKIHDVIRTKKCYKCLIHIISCFPVLEVSFSE